MSLHNAIIKYQDPALRRLARVACVKVASDYVIANTPDAQFYRLAMEIVNNSEVWSDRIMQILCLDDAFLDTMDDPTLIAKVTAIILKLGA